MAGFASCHFLMWRPKTSKSKKRKRKAEDAEADQQSRGRDESTKTGRKKPRLMTARCSPKQHPPRERSTSDETTALYKNPKEWDARKDMGLSIHLKDQGNTDFCWGFAAVTVVEYALQIYRGIDVRLSVQQVIDNVMWKRGDENSYEHALDYMMKHRVTLGKYYPFIGRNQEPRLLSPQEKKESYKIKDFETLDASDEEGLMRVLRKRGPVALGLCVDGGFTDLKGGIYPGLRRPFERAEHGRCAYVSDHSDESQDSYRSDKFEESGFGTNNGKHVHNLHAVVLIGFGTDDSKRESINYWIIQSNDGFQWGVGGIGRIRRDSSIRAWYHSPMLQSAIPIL